MSVRSLILSLALTGAVTKSADLASVVAEINKTYRTSFTNGTANGKIDMVFTDTRTLTASSSEDLDLAGGVTDAFGATMTFAEVTTIILVPAATNTNDVVIGGAASTPFVGPFADATDKVKVQPGGLFVAHAPNAGWAVGAGTADLLKVANGGSGTPVTYDIYIFGRSA